MQRSKFITGFFLILLLCNFQDAQSIDTSGRAIIGPKGEIAFFYNEEEKIVAVECEDLTHIRIPERRLDCMENPERVIFDGPVSNFEGSLKMVLKFPMENYSSEKIELYNNAQSIDIEGDSEKQEKLKSKIAEMEGWSKEYGAENADIEKLEKLQQELAEIEARQDKQANLKSITEEIDGEIKRLIGEISGDDFDDYVYSEDKESLAFNMLRGVFNYSPKALKFIRIEAAGKSFMMGSPEG